MARWEIIDKAQGTNSAILASASLEIINPSTLGRLPTGSYELDGARLYYFLSVENLDYTAGAGDATVLLDGVDNVGSAQASGGAVVCKPEDGYYFSRVVLLNRSATNPIAVNTIRWRVEVRRYLGP